MMLWPKRMVVPILPEIVTGPLDDLYLRYCRRYCSLILHIRTEVRAATQRGAAPAWGVRGVAAWRRRPGRQRPAGACRQWITHLPACAARDSPSAYRSMHSCMRFKAPLLSHTHPPAEISRHQGVLQIDVVRAKDLPRMDTVGTSEWYCGAAPASVPTPPSRTLRRLRAAITPAAITPAAPPSVARQHHTAVLLPRH